MYDVRQKNDLNADACVFLNEPYEKKELQRRKTMHFIRCLMRSIFLSQILYAKSANQQIVRTGQQSIINVQIISNEKKISTKLTQFGDNK